MASEQPQDTGGRLGPHDPLGHVVASLQQLAVGVEQEPVTAQPADPNVDPQAVMDLQKELDNILSRLVGKIDLPSEIDLQSPSPLSTPMSSVEAAAHKINVGHQILQSRIDAMKAIQEEKLKQWEAEVHKAELQEEELQKQLEEHRQWEELQEEQRRQLEIDDPTGEKRMDMAIVDVRRVIERIRLGTPETFTTLQMELDTTIGSEWLQRWGEDVVEKLKEEAQQAIEEALLRIERIKTQRRIEEQRVEQEEGDRQMDVELKALDADVKQKRDQKARRKKEQEVQNQLNEIDRTREQRKAEEEAMFSLRRCIERVRLSNPDNYESMKLELQRTLKQQLSLCGSKSTLIQDEADVALSQAAIRVDRMSTQRRVETLRREMSELEMKMKVEAQVHEVTVRAREQLELQARREEETANKLREIEQAKFKRQEEDQAVDSVRKAMERLRFQAVPETFEDLKTKLEETLAASLRKIIHPLKSTKIKEDVAAAIADAQLRVERISIQRQMTQLQMEKDELRREQEAEARIREAEEISQMKEHERKDMEKETKQHIQDSTGTIDRRFTEDQALREVRSAIFNLRSACPDDHSKMEAELKTALQTNLRYIESQQRLIKDEVQTAIEQTALRIHNLNTRDQLEELRRAREVARRKDEDAEKIKKSEVRGEQQDRMRRQREIELQEQFSKAEHNRLLQQEADRTVLTVRRICMRMRTCKPENWKELEAELDATLTPTAFKKLGSLLDNIKDEAEKCRVECRQRVERQLAHQQLEESLRVQRETIMRREKEAKEREMQEEKRREEEARRNRELETQRKLGDLENMRMRKQVESEALSAVRNVIEELRICTPEAYPDLRARLKDTLSKELDNAGSQASKIEEETQKALGQAESRVGRITAEREKQMQFRRAQEEKRQKEAEALAEEARETQRREQEHQDRVKLAADEKLGHVDAELQLHYEQEEALEFVRRTCDRLRKTDLQTFKDLQAVKQELDAIVEAKLKIAGPMTSNILKESQAFLDEARHRVGYFTSREKIEDERQKQDELRRQRDEAAEVRAKETEKRLSEELRNKRNGETRRQLEEIERSRLQRMVEDQTRGVVNELTQMVVRDGSVAGLDPTKALEEALMAN